MMVIEYVPEQNTVILSRDVIFKEEIETVHQKNEQDDEFTIENENAIERS